MPKEKKYTFSHFFGIYKYTCIILAIAGVGFLSSCSNQSSVRSSYLAKGRIARTAPAEKQKEEKPEQKIDNKHLKLIEEPVATQNQDLAVNSGDSPSGTMMPLDQQINEIKKEQASIREEITDIQNSLDNMQQTLLDLKEAVQYYIHNKKSTPVTGGEMKQEYDAPANDQFILQSDEEAKEKQNQRILPPKKNNEIRKPKNNSKPKYNAPKPKIENKNVEPNIPDYDEDDYGIGKNEDDKFNEALKKYAERDYKEAVRLLSELASQTSAEERKISCHYWMGEALFGMKNYDEAARNFSMVAGHNGSPRSDDAQIMVAESLMRSGKKEEAKMAFQQFIASYPSSEYMPRARKMLQQL